MNIARTEIWLTLRLKPSAIDFPLVNMLSEMICRYTNAHCHLDLREMPEAERLAELETLKKQLEELMH